MPAVCNKRLAVRHPQCQRRRPGRVPRRRGRWRVSVAFRPNRLTSIGSGKRPSVSTSLVSSAITIMRGRRRRDDLFAQQRPAAALDQGELRIDLVGAVDGEVEFRHFVERGERHAEFAAKRCGALRRRHAHDRHAGRDLLGQQPHELLGGRAGADAEPHAVLDMSSAARAASIFSAFASIACHAVASDCRRAAPSIFGRGGKGFARKGRESRLAHAAARGIRQPRHASARQLSNGRADAVMAKPIIVFDLDGTLVDTAPDLLDSLNHSLGAGGVAAHRHGGLPPVRRPWRPRDDRARLRRRRSKALPPTSTTGCSRCSSTTTARTSPASRSPTPACSRRSSVSDAAGYLLAVCTNKTEGFSQAADRCGSA